MSGHGHEDHIWDDRERVSGYVERMERSASERRSQLDLLVRMIPWPRDAAIRVLDLGAGPGPVASAVLEAFPHAEVVLLDGSEEMLRAARERLAPFQDRTRYVVADLSGGAIAEEAGGPFHAVVSSLAIHHFAGAVTRLYEAIYRRLEPGGCFLNLDLVRAEDDAVAALYQRLLQEDTEAHGHPPLKAPERHRFELQSVSDHIGWLHGAGFEHTDCAWKQLGTALVAAYRAPVRWPEAPEPTGT